MGDRSFGRRYWSFGAEHAANFIAFGGQLYVLLADAESKYRVSDV